MRGIGEYTGWRSAQWMSSCGLQPVHYTQMYPRSSDPNDNSPAYLGTARVWRFDRGEDAYRNRIAEEGWNLDRQTVWLVLNENRLLTCGPSAMSKEDWYDFDMALVRDHRRITRMEYEAAMRKLQENRVARRAEIAAETTEQAERRKRINAYKKEYRARVLAVKRDDARLEEEKPCREPVQD